MPKRRKVWMYCPPKAPKPEVPDSVKAEVSAKAQELVDEHLKIKYLEPPPEKSNCNYLKDLSTKWFRSYFYFCATYFSPFPDAISPTFEIRFARMEYVGDGKFDLAYMRHTGQWWPIHFRLTIDECFKAIQDEPHFIP
jgi:hypothetical protein